MKKVLVRQVDGLDFLKLLIFRKQGHKEQLITILMSQLVKFLIMDYADMEFDDAFDGIWGNEALIHVPEDELPGILEKLTEALCQNGILFLSFQEGDFEGQRSGRYFCEYTREELERILTETGRLEILKLWTTEDEDREEGDKLLNVLAKKIS